MNHGCDPRPLQSHEVIWKYMDDWKFSKMLEAYSNHDQWINGDGRKTQYRKTGRLWFSYPHSFGEALEGTFPAINNDPEKLCNHVIENRGLEGDEADEFKRTFLSAETQTLRKGIDHMAQISGVSCWHINDQESALMWGKFTYNKNAIALKTTVGELNNAIRQNYSGIPFRDINCLSCEVGYIDYEKYFLEYDGYYGLLSIVSKEHSDEKEARFIIDSFRGREVRKSMRIPVSPEELMDVEKIEERKKQHRRNVSELAQKKYQEMKNSDEDGFYFPLNLQDMKFEIIFKANCDSDYIDQVNGRMKSLGLGGVQF